MNNMKLLGAALLCMAATTAWAGTPALPAGYQFAVVGEDVQVNGVTTDMYQFLRNEPADQVVEDVRRLWQSRSNEPIFADRIGDDRILSQRVGERWLTVRVKEASFGRSSGIYASARVFAKDAVTKTPFPFALPEGTTVARHIHSRDQTLVSDMWILKNGLSVSANAAMLVADMSTLGAKRDASVRYPGPPDRSWAGAFNSKTQQWTMTVQHNEDASYIVVNRVYKD
ncbi:MAG: hypothetical protein JO002_06685 [Burkholderiaceae bacterium]|nr:hypothetical protein [Burkholderiaceae bacterium]